MAKQRKPGQRRWTAQEVARMIEENIEDWSLRFDLKFLCTFFRVDYYSVRAMLMKRNIYYLQARYRMIDRFIERNSRRMKIGQMADILELDPQTIRKRLRMGNEKAVA